MGAVLTVLFVLAISLIVVRVATVSLTLTGLSHQTARFQARSAFTGSGFTTKESEKVVNHPVRRRIILILMLLGNAGIVTAIASVMLSFVGSDDPNGWVGSLWARALVLIGGCLILWRLSYSAVLDRWMSRVIGWAIQRWTNIDTRDYAALLRLRDEYTVAELHVQDHDWLAGKSLGELQLSQEGVLVLGIERANGTFLGAPRGERRLEPGDLLLIYGRQKALADLDERQTGLRGNLAHLDAVSEQQTIQKKEEVEDQERPSTTSN